MGRGSNLELQPNPLNLIEAERVARPVIELVVRVDSSAAIPAAVSMVPPFSRNTVMPMARKVWQQAAVESPAECALR